LLDISDNYYPLFKNCFHSFTPCSLNRMNLVFIITCMHMNSESLIAGKRPAYSRQSAMFRM
jgi:hypothetical protein